MVTCQKVRPTGVSKNSLLGHPNSEIKSPCTPINGVHGHHITVLWCPKREFVWHPRGADFLAESAYPLFGVIFSFSAEINGLRDSSIYTNLRRPRDWWSNRPLYLYWPEEGQWDWWSERPFYSHWPEEAIETGGLRGPTIHKRQRRPMNLRVWEPLISILLFEEGASVRYRGPDLVVLCVDYRPDRCT